MARSSKTMKSAKKSKNVSAEQTRSEEEMKIITSRLERTAEHRRVHVEQIGETPTLKLGDKGIVSPRHLELKIYNKVKMIGIDLFLN